MPEIKAYIEDHSEIDSITAEAILAETQKRSPEDVTNMLDHVEVVEGMATPVVPHGEWSGGWNFILGECICVRKVRV